MALSLTDLPLETLRDWRPEVADPVDFDEFWIETLAAARAAGGAVRLTDADTPVRELIVQDLTFPGFAADPIRAWVVRPRSAEPLPAVIEFVGYGGGRGAVSERLAWAAAGFVHVVMDTRGQGSVWGGGGETPDPHGSGAATPGFMTRGILSPDDYYYRRVYVDGVRLVDAVGDLPFVDPARMTVTGTSQGGGIAIAVGSLSDAVHATMPDVPFLCHFERSIQRTPEPPFTEITRYLSIHRDDTAQVLTTLSYFDGVNFARRMRVPAFFSVGLMDEVVLPSSVFAAFNHLPAHPRHRIEVYPYNGHEGGQSHQWRRQVEWLGALD